MSNNDAPNTLGEYLSQQQKEVSENNKGKGSRNTYENDEFYSTEGYKNLLDTYGKEELDMRRKAEVLEYKKLQPDQKSSQMRYSDLLKTNRNQFTKDYVTNNPNIERRSNGVYYLKQVRSSTKYNASASGVPGNTQLYMKKNIPLRDVKPKF